MRARALGRDVFVDTSGYYAAAIREDSNHAIASATMERSVGAKHRLITTNFVLAELHSLILSRVSREVAIETVTVIIQSDETQLVRVEEEDEGRAWAILAHYDDKDFTLTDATSFAVMERLGLRTAFALDRHFVQYGWDVVPLSAWGSG